MDGFRSEAINVSRRALGSAVLSPVTASFLFVPRLRMRGATPPLAHGTFCLLFVVIGPAQRGARGPVNVAQGLRIRRQKTRP